MRKLVYLLLIFPSFSVAQKGSSVTLKETNHGIFTADVVSTESNNNTATGKNTYLSNVLFYPITDTVPLIKGTNFGIQFILESDKVKMAEIEVVWLYPSVMTNTEGKEFVDNKSTSTRAIGYKTFTGFMLTENFELIPGKWTLQIFYKKQKIHEHIFYIVEE